MKFANLNKRFRAAAISGTFLTAGTVLGFAACATPTDASMTLLSEFPCDRVMVELYTGPTLAEARKKVRNNEAPAAIVAAASSKSTGNLRTCDGNAEEAIKSVLNNLGSMTLFRENEAELGAVVAIVEVRADSESNFAGGTVCRTATDPNNENSDTRCLRAEAQFAYVQNARVSFALRLTSACLGVNCGDGRSCDNGTCVIDRKTSDPKPGDAGTADAGTADGGVIVPPSQVCRDGVVYAGGVRCSVGCVTSKKGVADSRSCAAGPQCVASDAELCCATPLANPAAPRACCVPPRTADGTTAQLALPRIIPGSAVCPKNSGGLACFSDSAGACPAGQLCDFRAALGYGVCLPSPMICVDGNPRLPPTGTALSCSLVKAPCLSTINGSSSRVLNCRGPLVCRTDELVPCCAVRTGVLDGSCCLKDIGGVGVPVVQVTSCGPQKTACFRDGDCMPKPIGMPNWRCNLEPTLGWGSCGNPP